MTVLLLPALCCALGAGYFLLAELTGFGRSRAGLARAASYGRSATATVAGIPGPQRARRELPFAHVLASMTLRLAPGRERGKTASQLHAAGLGRVSAETFLALKSGLALTGMIVGCAVGATVAPRLAIILAIIGGGVAFVLPDVVLRSRAHTRREQLLGELPNALDLLAVIVEAGLGLDAALARYAETNEGPLGEEVALLVTELRVGSSRAEVLARFAERVPAPETKAFVRAVVHADQLGTSLSGALRTQAQEVRYRRQAAAEERANKAPVKMLFPTVFCIFPVLFVVVLGPVLLNLVHSL
jgi:tight adherence protein C